MTRLALLAFVPGCAWLDAGDRAAFLDRDGDGVQWIADCDDADATVGSGYTFYVDDDGDGFGDSGRLTDACEQVPGLSPDRGDCDDADPDVRPSASERCDDALTDEDCDGFADDLDPEGALLTATWFVDGDDDGYGAGEGVVACAGPTGRVPNDDDCNDAAPDVHPAAGERCGPVDDDCDFLVDAADPDLANVTPWFVDFDGDGQGNPSTAELSCEPLTGRISTGGDCDDTDPDVYVGAPEVWYDGVDSDCDGLSDDDADRDGFDAAAEGGDDCDDTDDATFPGAPEVWYDDVDQGCDGGSDHDADADGHDRDLSGGDDCDDDDASAFPDAEEFFDGLDSDCDGQDGVCGDVTRRVPGDHTTLALAVSAACDGDVIDFTASGVTPASLVVDKAITIRARAPALLTPSNGNAPILTASKGRFEGLSFTNYTAAPAVHVLQGTGVVVSGARFLGDGDTAAGALFVDRSPLTQVRGCEFDGNQAPDGGAVRIVSSPDTVVADSTFLGNSATVDGGAVYVASSARVIVDDCVFEGNSAGDEGGALALHGFGAYVEGGQMRDNVAGLRGGAVYISDTGATVRDVDFEANAPSTLYVHDGDAWIDGCRLAESADVALFLTNAGENRVTNNLFEDNLGRGLYVNLWDDGYWRVEDNVFLRNVGGLVSASAGELVGATFDGNTAGDGAAFTLGGAPVVVEDVLVTNSACTSTWGNAVRILGSTATVRGLTVLGSANDGLAVESESGTLSEVVVAGSRSRGLELSNAANVVIDHLTLVANGADGVDAQSTATGVLRHAIIASNDVGVTAGTNVTLVDCLLWDNRVPFTGGVVPACAAADPAFTSWGRRLVPARYDLHLAPGSPARDAGTGVDADGTAADLGAYGGPDDVLGAEDWYADLDADGLYDGWEATHGLDPGRDDAAEDDDADGATNLAEFTAGTWPEHADTDADGHLDGAELAAGTDPLDPIDP